MEQLSGFRKSDPESMVPQSNQIVPGTRNVEAFILKHVDPMGIFSPRHLKKYGMTRNNWQT